jgi:hypothetical protein
MTLNGKRLVEQALGRIKLGLPEPKWFDVVARLFPPFDLTTPPAIGLNLGRLDENDWDKANKIKGLHRRQRAKSEILMKTVTEKFGRPSKLAYPEDKVRKRFLREHPGELSRPLNLNEQDCFDESPELVVKKYNENLCNSTDRVKLTQEEAYQRAVKEFYATREGREASQLSVIRQNIQTSGVTVQDMLNESIDKVIKEEQRRDEVKKSSDSN